MAQQKGKIVISEFMAQQAVTALSTDFEVLYDPDLVDDAPSLTSQLRDASALIVRNRTQVNAALLEAAPDLKVVGRLGVGLDNIDLPACMRRGVTVFPATGANSRSVAEYVIAATLLLCRGSYFSSSEVARGLWPRAALSSGREIYGRTLGIVGFGGIGRMVARLAQGLGMHTLAHDPAWQDDSVVWRENHARSCSLPELLESSDVVTLHIPLVPATRRLFDAARIASMRPGSILINTSRGGVVDESAVVAALESGHLRGAALDVFEREPLVAHHDFQNLPGLVLTPHIAGVTVESNQRVSEVVADQVRTFLSRSGETP